jgi:hypothetical protein
MGSKEAADEWLRTFNHQVNAVSMFGTDPVREATKRLVDAVREVMAMEDAYVDSPQEAKLIAAEEKLVDAIRLDTAPPPPPPPPPARGSAGHVP